MYYLRFIYFLVEKNEGFSIMTCKKRKNRCGVIKQLFFVGRVSVNAAGSCKEAT